MKLLLSLTLLLPTLLFGKTIILNDKNTINFNEPFNAVTVANRQLELFKLASNPEIKDIYIVMYTPGGSVSAGSLFIDTANSLGKNVHTITIFSASMGYHTVQGLGNRYILPSGRLMSHRAFVSGLTGQFPGELNTRVDMLMSSTRLLDETAAKRVGLTLEEYKKLIHDELWLTGQDAVDAGHADEVIQAKCDESLSGSDMKLINTFFGKLSVEYARCPLIVGPISIGGDMKAVKWAKDTMFGEITKRIKLEL